MPENMAEVAAGAIVLAAAAAFTIYAGQITGFARGTGSYELVASFRSADGVTAGTDVRLAGVKVGTVTRIELNPDTFFADAVLSIDPRIRLPDDSSALISQEGLLGGSYVELQPGGSLVTIERGGRIFDTQGSVSLITLLLRAVGGDGGTGDPGLE